MSYISNTVNPQSILPDVSSYYVYAQDKNSRKQVQNQGKQIANNVNFLHRKAKQQVKQLNKTQVNLVSLYSKRLSKYDQQQKKVEFRKIQEQKLRQLKNISSLNRYLHSLKKQQSSRDIYKRNLTSAKTVKQQHRMSQQKMRIIKANQAYQLKLRNQQSSRLRKTRNQISRQQSFNQKRRLSATINGTLRLEQNKLIDKQIEKINELSRKQQQLIQIVQRSKKHKEKVQGKIQKIRDMHYQQIYSEVINFDRRRHSAKKDKTRALQF